MLREHTFSDLAYLGIREDQHWYSIDGNEIPVDAIEELESVEERKHHYGILAVSQEQFLSYVSGYPLMSQSIVNHF